MKKILMSLMALAIIVTPLTLARPHYNTNPSNVNGSSNLPVSKDAKNYQNLKGNYKVTPSGSNNVVNSIQPSGSLNNTNNLKSNYAGSSPSSVSGANNVNKNRR